MTHKYSLALLGVSFENISLDEAAQKILALIDMHTRDHLSRYVCTVNVDFMVQAHSLNWSKVGNPEILDIYRRSSLATCDGKPLLWLSRLLGGSLQERVTGADLVPKLAALLAKHNKTLYLLGSSEQINKVTALILEALNPGLRIVGRLTPYVFTEGEELVNAQAQDRLIVEEINQACPDLLLIAFGNPKQEKWFDRVKDQLNVPVSIGVGGCFEIISGALTRAPLWMQKAGLEWFYRLLQEPKRLWKRYLLDSWKFLGIAAPLICYHTISWLLYRLSKGSAQPLEHPLLFLSATQTIAMVPLPALLDGEYCHLTHAQLDEIFNQDTVILDFENVRHITVEGFALLNKIWRDAEISGRELYAINISGDLRVLIKAHRSWDLIKDSVMGNPHQVIKALIQGKSHPDYFESLQQNRDHLVIYFFGRIGIDQNKGEYLEQLAPLLREKNCILDFRYCTHIENGGFSFLLQLKKIVDSQGYHLFVRRRSPLIIHLFRLSKVDTLFVEA